MSSGLLPCDDDWGGDVHNDDGDDHEEEEGVIVGVDGK